MALQERKNDYNITSGYADRAGSPVEMNGCRKLNKPLIERRRRARINSSLSQLKTMVVDVLNKQTFPKNKIEKADVLEMAVKYIRNMQRKQMQSDAKTNPEVINNYKSGFFACAQEVTSFLSKGGNGIDETTKLRLLDHLANSLQGTASKEGENTAPSPTSQESRVHSASWQASKRMTPSSNQASGKSYIQATSLGQENLPTFRQMSPLSTIDTNCLRLTPPPTVCNSQVTGDSPVLLSNQGGSWTRVSYPGGATGFNELSRVSRSSSQVSQPSPVYGDAYTGPRSSGEVGLKASTLQGQVPPSFYHNDMFGDRDEAGDGEVWRPW